MLLKFTLILKNNTSNEVSIYNNLYGEMSYTQINFEDVFFDSEDGEYTYLLFLNYRKDVDYNLKSDIAESDVVIGDNIFPIKMLNPIIGLLKIENNKIKNNIYNNEYNLFFYK